MREKLDRWADYVPTTVLKFTSKLAAEMVQLPTLLSLYGGCTWKKKHNLVNVLVAWAFHSRELYLESGTLFPPVALTHKVIDQTFCKILALFVSFYWIYIKTLKLFSYIRTCMHTSVSD